MKYYAHHIGDFDRATRHLSRIERSVYRDLIDLYYDTEEQLTLDTQALCRRIIARTDEEATAVEQVLNEFFTQTPTGWYHDRCEEEIESYRASNSQKSAAGKASAAKRAAKREQALNGISTTVATPVERTSNGSATNHEPVTINQEPITPDGVKTKRERARSIAKPDDVTEQTWSDWLQLRKSKKAPVTETVLSGAKTEAGKANLTLEQFLQVWCTRGSQGLQAEWLKPSERGRPAGASSHSGFSGIDYNKGINEDGTFD